MKRKKEKKPPVQTGRDHRAEEGAKDGHLIRHPPGGGSEDASFSSRERHSRPEAPDGVSGSWT